MDHLSADADARNDDGLDADGTDNAIDPDTTVDSVARVDADTGVDAA